MEKAKELAVEQIRFIAQATHEMNRAYCCSIGDMTQLPWEQAPEWQKDSALLGVQAVIDDPSVTPSQLHDGWSAVKIADGWSHGATKDADAKTHPCLVPYEDLPAEQRAKDYLFRITVLTLCAAIGDPAEFDALSAD